MIEWYEPDEDTYTLIDVLKEENISNKVILDLGTSTGIITDTLSHKELKNTLIGLDLNLKALYHQDRKSRNLIRGDLLNSINQAYIDIIIFNPPYVLDSNDPIVGGGVYGRDVIDRFINEVSVNLFYLLVIQANKYKEIINLIEKKGYHVEIKKVRRILGETIIILKCYKNKVSY